MPTLNRLVSKYLLLSISLFILLVAPALTAHTQSQLASDLRQKVDGVATHYGLGIGIRSDSGRRVLEHGGEVSGFPKAQTSSFWTPTWQNYFLTPGL